MNFCNHTLKNGLHLVAECNDEAHSTALGFFVEAGARDETDAVAGVSHFLEHMAFKGTPTRSADDVNRRFDELGAHYNAGTSEENTVYYAAVLPEHHDAAVELLADIMRPSLREDDFDTEKQVIVEEIRMYDDQPPFGADEKARAAYFGPHPLGRSVRGTVKSISDLPGDAMREYFRCRYSPGNITLIACGKVDFDALVARAEQSCGHWEPFDCRRTAEPTTLQAGFQAIRKEIATQQYALSLSEAPAAVDPDRYAAKLLAVVLGDDTGSRLYWELVDTGLAEHVSLGHSEYADAGIMMTYLSCEPDAAAANLQTILDVYRRAESDGVTAAELKQAKSKLSSRIVLSGERPRGRLFAVGSDWVYRRRHCSIEDDLAAVAGITAEEVSAVLAKYPLSRSTTLTIGPLDDVAAPM